LENGVHKKGSQRNSALKKREIGENLPTSPDLTNLGAAHRSPVACSKGARALNLEQALPRMQ